MVDMIMSDLAAVFFGFTFFCLDVEGLTFSSMCSYGFCVSTFFLDGKSGAKKSRSANAPPAG